jgi:hypothetical protein
MTRVIRRMTYVIRLDDRPYLPECAPPKYAVHGSGKLYLV